MEDTTDGRLPKLLVVGATGKQGQAVIQAILGNPVYTPFQVLALTRDETSEIAIDLDSKHYVVVVQGDPTMPANIFREYSPITAVFLVTAFKPGKPNNEENQAHAIIDASIRNNVKQFVFSSVDRGGQIVSEENPTNIEHFATKHRIEKYLREKNSAAANPMSITILRPVCFMDNLTDDFSGKVFATLWKGIGVNKSLQLVSTRDIGIFAAAAIMEPDKYNGRAISLAGDSLTFSVAKQIFKDTTKTRMPETFGIIGRLIKLTSRELKHMFNWFETDGYGANIDSLRDGRPRPRDFRTWLAENSDFATNPAANQT